MAKVIWGDLPLNAMTFQAPVAETFLTEKPLIPSPASTGPQSVLVGVGRKRKKASMTGWATLADYESIETDRYNYTARVLTMPNGQTMTAIVQTLEGEIKPGTDSLVFYSLSFIEGV